MYACINGRDEVVQLLINAGANKDIQDKVCTLHTCTMGNKYLK